MRTKIGGLQGSGRTKRVLTFLKDPKQIEEMEKDLDRVLARFHVSTLFHADVLIPILIIAQTQLDKELRISQDVGKTVNMLCNVAASRKF